MFQICINIDRLPLYTLLLDLNTTLSVANYITLTNFSNFDQIFRRKASMSRDAKLISLNSHDVGVDCAFI